MSKITEGRFTPKSVELKKFNHGVHTISVHTHHGGEGHGGDMESGDITHGIAKKANLRRYKIPHHDQDDYGERVRVRVENNETGAVTHHSVYQAGKDHKGKHVMSVRSFGKPNVAHKNHAALIHGLLGKEVKPFGEGTEMNKKSINELAMSALVTRINELSIGTLKSYVKKAGKQGDRAYAAAGKEEDKSMATDGNKYPEKQARHQAAANKHLDVWRKRHEGQNRAYAKMPKVADPRPSFDKEKVSVRVLATKKPKTVKEETEVNELSIGALKSYAQKARAQSLDHKNELNAKGFKKTLFDKYRKRREGVETATRKIGQKVHESVIIDEVSRELLKRYRAKAKADGVAAWNKGDAGRESKRRAGYAKAKMRLDGVTPKQLHRAKNPMFESDDAAKKAAAARMAASVFGAMKVKGGKRVVDVKKQRDLDLNSKPAKPVKESLKG